MSQPHWKSIPTLNCWTQLAHSIFIRLKQVLSLQNTDIWTSFSLLVVIIKICISIALLILLLYFVLENCVFYVTMKKETIGKSNTGIAILEIKLEFEKKRHVFTYIHLPRLYRFICVCALFQRIVVCLISVKQMHTFV